MSAIFELQNNFNLGELTPLILSRVDFAGFYKGVRQARNVISIPTGGLKKKFGMKFLESVRGSITDSTEVKIYPVFTPEGTYFFLFRNLAVDIYQNGAFVNTVVTPYTTSQISELKFAQSEYTLIICHEDVETRYMTTSAGVWGISIIPFNYVPSVDFDNNYDSINFTPSATSGATVTLTASSAYFSAQWVDGIFIGNGGVMRFDTFTDSTHMIGTVVQEFIDTSLIAGEDSVLAEPAFSSTRGWPKSATFFQGRLIFGGHKVLPTGIFASQSGEHFNFDNTGNTDASAFTVFIQADGSTNIEYLTGDLALIVATDSGIFASQFADDTPLTGSNIALHLQTPIGSSNVHPRVMDNQYIFFDKGGKSVWGLVYDGNKGAFDSTNISVLSTPLIRTPVDSATFRNVSDIDGEFLFIVNADGTLVVFDSLLAQQVAAWTLCSTPGGSGKIKQVASINGEAIFLVERTIDGATVLNLETLDFDCYTDSCSTYSFGSPTTSLTGLAHLEGESVQVKGDGTYLGFYTVTSGAITLTDAVTTAEVGFQITATIIPMPIVLKTALGFDIYTPKTVKGIIVDYYESLSIMVNGKLIPQMEFGGDILDSAPVPKTGFSEVGLFAGSNPRAEITISQNEPYDMTIIGLGMTVEIGDNQ